MSFAASSYKLCLHIWATEYNRGIYKIFLDQTNLLELLHVLTSHSRVVFSTQNRDPEFIICLTHWLLVVGLLQDARKKSFNNITFCDVSDDEEGNGISYTRSFMFFISLVTHTSLISYHWSRILYKIALLYKLSLVFFKYFVVILFLVTATSYQQYFS